MPRSAVSNIGNINAPFKDALQIQTPPFTLFIPKYRSAVTPRLFGETPALDSIELGCDGDPSLDLFDQMISDKGLRKVSRRLFADGHYTPAVEQACKYVINKVKAKSGLHSNGYPLMHQAFGGNRPVLRLNNLKTQSESDEQRGYAEIFCGVIMGIRNPRAHEYKMMDNPRSALELLTLCNHLMRQLLRASIW